MVGTKTKIGGASAAFMLIASVFYSLIIINPDITVTVGQPGIFNFTTTDRGTLYIYGTEDTEFGVDVEFVKIIKWDGKERQPSRILTEEKVLSDGTVLPPGTHVFPNWGYRSKVWNNNQFIYIPLKSGKHHFRLVYGTQKAGYLILDAYNEANIWPPYTYENGAWHEDGKTTLGDEKAYQRWDGVWLKEKDLDITNGNWPYLITETVNFFHISRLGESLGRPIPITGKHKFEPGYIEWSYEIPAASMAAVRATFITKTLKQTNLKQFIWIAPTVRDANNIFIDMLNDTQLLNAAYPVTVYDPWKVNSSGADSTWGNGTFYNMTEDLSSGDLVLGLVSDDFSDGSLHSDWVEYKGPTVTESGGNLTFAGTDSSFIALNNESYNFTDILILSRINPVSNGRGAIGGRWVFNGQNFGVSTFYGSRFREPNNDITIRKAGDSNISAYALTAGQWYVWNMKIYGTTIETYPENVINITLTDSDYTWGSIVLGEYTSTEIAFDYLRVVETDSSGNPRLTGNWTSETQDSGSGNEAKNGTVIFSEYNQSVVNASLWINGTSIQTNISNNTNYNIPSGYESYNITIQCVTADASYTCAVESITVWEGSAAAADNNPVSTLNSPVDNYNSSSTTIIFNCSATDDLNVTNISLYGNWSGGWHSNETNTTCSGTSCEVIFNKTIPEGVYVWNCEATDNASQTDFAANRTFTISTGTIDSKVYVYNGTDYVENDIFYNIYCSFGESCCAPDDQSASKSFIDVENNGTANGTGIRCKVNATVGAIDFLFGNSSTCGDSYNVTTSWTTIWSETIGQNTNRSIWIWGTWGRPTSWPDVEYICEVE